MDIKIFLKYYIFNIELKRKVNILHNNFIFQRQGCCQGSGAGWSGRGGAASLAQQESGGGQGAGDALPF